MQGTVASVPLDAAMGEYFILPAGFGDIALNRLSITIYSLSGTYVAPAPIYAGISVHIQNATGTTEVDTVGTTPYVNVSTSSARPVLEVNFDLVRRILFQQNERLVIEAPVIAGAGITASVDCRLRGTRLRLA